jgi:uncharacterized protein (TIGR02453 family)
MSSFSPGLFTFLRQLKSHNNREWFEANRARYVADVEAPMLQFIADLAPRLRAISKAIVVDRRRFGGSMYRIYRDTRFSADKSPYKTHVAAHFRHEGRKTHHSVPGFYLHLEPGGSIGGGGIYHPDAPTLARIRTAMVENEKAWAAVKKLGLEIEGETLKRAPAGFDAKHRFVDDLKRKDIYALVSFTDAEVVGPDFLDRYTESCHRVAPLVEFLATALRLKW